MVSKFELAALWVQGFGPWVVTGEEGKKILYESVRPRPLGVGLVKPSISLRRDKGWGDDLPCGGVDTNHVSSHVVPRGCGGGARDV